MKSPVRIQYSGTLPDSFFALAARLYAGLPFRLQEAPRAVAALLELEAERNEIVLYTDHENMRLMGIFPQDAGEQAFFGFWETTQDVELNKAAFSLLQDDARKREKKKLSGPINFNTFHPYRLRLGVPPSWHAFDREPVNPPYYADLLLELGFEAQLRFESRRLGKASIPALYQDKKLLLEEVDKIPFDFIPVNRKVWQACEAEIYQLVGEIFSSNPAYKPVSLQQFRLLYDTTFAARLCPHTSVLLRHRPSGRLAAMSFCHPNYQSLGLPPELRANFARDYPRLHPKVLLAKSVGVHPGFRGQGLMNALGAYGMLRFREYYEEVIFCLMRSDNYSTHFTDSLPYEAARYALFRKSLT